MVNRPRRQHPHFVDKAVYLRFYEVVLETEGVVALSAAASSIAVSSTTAPGAAASSAEPSANVKPGPAAEPGPSEEPNAAAGPVAGAPHPRMRIEIARRTGGRGGRPSSISVDVQPALLGFGLLLAAIAYLFGTDGVAAASDVRPAFDAALRGAGWGVVGVGALFLTSRLARLKAPAKATGAGRAVSAGRAGRLPLLANPRSQRIALSALLLAALPAFWLAFSDGSTVLPASVAVGALAGLAVAEWVSLLARCDSWGLMFHVSCSVVVAGVFYLLGFLQRGSLPASMLYAGALVAASCVALVAAKPGADGATEAAEASGSVGNGGLPVGKAPHGEAPGDAPGETPETGGMLQTAADFLRTQWAPLAGVMMLAFVHGLRWRSTVLGDSIVKPYETGGWEFAIGPVLAFVAACALLSQVGDASPQRRSCQVFLPVASAVLLVIPTLNPLYGFYYAADASSAVFVALEIALDVLNEAAMSLLFATAFVSAVTSVRTAGVGARTVAAALLASCAGGLLLGLYGYTVVGRNGRIVCFLVWTVYLLAMGLSYLGAGKADRETRRLSRESVENFIRRTSHALAVRHGLSQREEEILRYLARGYSYTYTAQDFFISENTVRTHAKHIYAKLGISKREELFRMFDEAGAPQDGSPRDGGTD